MALNSIAILLRKAVHSEYTDKRSNIRNEINNTILIRAENPRVNRHKKNPDEFAYAGSNAIYEYRFC